MSQVKNLMGYLIQHSNQPVSLGRMALLLYLCDWKCALLHGRQITDLAWRIRWMPTPCGVEPGIGIHKLAAEPPFGLAYRGMSGRVNGRVAHLVVMDARALSPLTATDQAIANFVLDISQESTFRDLLHLVCCTYPHLVTNHAQPLDLASLARAYQALEQEMEPAPTLSPMAKRAMEWLPLLSGEEPNPKAPPDTGLIARFKAGLRRVLA